MINEDKKKSKKAGPEFMVPSLNYLHEVKNLRNKRAKFSPIQRQCFPVKVPLIFKSKSQYIKIMEANNNAEYKQTIINSWESYSESKYDGWRKYNFVNDKFIIPSVDFLEDSWAGHLVEIEFSDKLGFVNYCTDTEEKLKDTVQHLKIRDGIRKNGKIRSLGYIGSFIKAYSAISSLNGNLSHLQKELLKIIMNPSVSSAYPFKSNLIKCANLDSSIIPINKLQLQAVKGLNSGFDIIQGPPGTGKSTTIWHIINYRIKPDSKCLITSTRNQAIISVIEKVQSFGLIVFGREEKLGEIAKNYILENLIEKNAEVQFWKKIAGVFTNLNKNIESFKEKIIRIYEKKYSILKYTKNERNGKTLWAIAFKGILNSKITESLKLWDTLICSAILKLQHIRFSVFHIQGNAILTKASVFLCTIDSTSSLKRSFERFQVKNAINTCIVDEAGCILETAIPILLEFNLENLVLIGDHLQLQPFSCWPASILQETNHSRSLMERAVLLKSNSWFLDTQYRMHPKICNMVSTMFYNEKLKTAVSIKRDVKFTPPCVWINQNGKERNHLNAGYSNMKEAKRVQKLAISILSQSNSDDKIFVITFYNMQLKLILDLFEKDNILKTVLGKTVFVLSIDASQGSEADYVIISTVRTDYVSSFMKNERRLCVAFSRAKNACFVVGKSKMIKQKAGHIWKGVSSHYRDAELNKWL